MFDRGGKAEFPFEPRTHHKHALPILRYAIIGSLDHLRSGNLVPGTFKLPNGKRELLPSVEISEPRHILNYECGRTKFGDYPNKIKE